MKIVTACTFDCPDACSLIAERKAEGIKLRGNPIHPFTAGFCCFKPKRLLQRAGSAQRITRPLLRDGSGWREISWSRALDLCAEQIQRWRDEPAAVLHLRGDGNKGILRLFSDLFFSRLQASTTRGSLCDEAGIAACIEDFGSLDSNDITTLMASRHIVNWGKDLSRTSIHTGDIVSKARKKGARVTTISPGGDGNARFSDHFIRIRPGTDRFLAAAVAALLLRRGLVDGAVREKARHLEAFETLLNRCDVAELANLCEVSPEQVDHLVRAYTSERPTATLIGWGLQRYRFGAETVRFINALAFLSGNIGKVGGGSIFNISSLRNFNIKTIEHVLKKPRRSLLLPAIGREIQDAANPPIRMVWVNGTNVVNQAPEALRVAEALRRVPFTVVVDAFMTDTAAVADLVLPCALMFEQEDVVGSYLHDYVNHVAPVLEPPAEARSDVDILKDLAARLDPEIELPTREVFLDTLLQNPVLQTTLSDLRRKGFVRANRSTVAYSGLRFDHDDGKYRLPTDLHREPKTQASYPLQLLSLIRRRAIHSQMDPDEQIMPPVVSVSPQNPCLADLDPGKPVYLASPLGRLRVQLRYENSLHPGAVVYRRDDWMMLGGGVNRLISAMVTDRGENTAYYSQRVRLEN